MPASAMVPFFTTWIRSASAMVASRWAMTSVVRPSESASSARRICRVQRRGRLVQDQDRRVPQEHPGNRQTLLLSARQLHPTLADDRIEPVGQTLQDLAEPGAASGLEDLGIACIEAAIGDVLVPPNRNTSCGTIPILARRLRWVMSRPSMVIRSAPTS